MNLPFYIARRYLFSKKSRNVINVITGISVVVIAFVTAAMVVVLSAFNGIDDLVDDLYSNFDGDLDIRPSRGQLVFADSLDLESIRAIEGVAEVYPVLEQNVLLGYEDRQRLATIRGVPDGYMRAKSLDESIYEGSAFLEDENSFWAIIGYGIKLDLDASLSSLGFEPLLVHAPRKGRRISKYKEKAFKTEAIPIGGIFSINMEYDSEYLLVSYAFARDLLELREGCHYYEVLVNPGADVLSIRDELTGHIKGELMVQTREEKNSLIYQANASERLVTICILSFIILIATFNILASLTMLMIDKRKDIRTMSAMGASTGLVRNIFFSEGMLISLFGAIIGLVIGVLLCLAQQHIGLIPLKGGIVPYYPVVLRGSDILLVFGIVLLIAFLFSWWPVRRMTKGLLLDPVIPT